MDLSYDYITNNYALFFIYHSFFYTAFWLLVYTFAERVSTYALLASQTQHYKNIYAGLVVADLCSATHQYGFTGEWILFLAGFFYVVTAYQVYLMAKEVKTLKRLKA